MISGVIFTVRCSKNGGIKKQINRKQVWTSKRDYRENIQGKEALQHGLTDTGIDMSFHTYTDELLFTTPI